MEKFNLEITGKFKSTTKGHSDWYYGGGEDFWPDIISAIQGVPLPVRSGKTVGISIEGKVEEYIWHPNDTSDTGLVPKLDLEKIDEQLLFIKDVIRVAPTYINPTSSITNVTQTVERGATLTNLSVNISFVQNDSGSPIGYSLENNSVEISTAQNSLITLPNIISNQVLKGIVNYSEGITKNDNLGEPYTGGKILSGSVQSATRTITPRLKFFFGSSASVPTNSAGVRSLASNQFDNDVIVNLSTGTTQVNFICAIPFTRTITSVLDTGNLNTNITSSYTLRGTFDVQDAGGNLVSYKIFAMTNSIPYSPSTIHKITIS